MSPKNDASDLNNKSYPQIESLAERTTGSQTETSDLGFSLQLSLVLGEYSIASFLLVAFARLVINRIASSERRQRCMHVARLVKYPPSKPTFLLSVSMSRIILYIFQ